MANSTPLEAETVVERLRAEVAALRAQVEAGDRARAQRRRPLFGRRDPEAPHARARSSRRGLLGTAAKAAAAAVAAGVLAEQVGTRPAFADNQGFFSSSISGETAVQATGTNGAVGVVATSDTNAAVNASSGSQVGVVASSTSFYGVIGYTFGASASGVYGENDSNSAGGIAILGHSDNGFSALGPGIGVKGETASGYGVYGTATGGYGVVAHSASGTALSAGSGTGSAVVASSGGVGYGLYLTAAKGWAIGCNGRIRVLGAAVGTATLKAGTTSTSVSSTACSGGSQVILTPTSNPQVSIWATIAPGAFTIHASSAPSADVTLSYLLIN